MLRRLKGTVKEEIWNSMPSKLPPLIISGGANNFAATSFKIKREDACNQVIKHTVRITSCHIHILLDKLEHLCMYSYYYQLLQGSQHGARLISSTKGLL